MVRGSPSRERLQVRPLLLDVLRVYRRHWRLLVPMAAVVLVPQALAESALDPIEAPRLEAWTEIVKLALLPGEVIASLVGEAFYAGLVAAAVLEWRAGRRLPRPWALARSIPYRRLIAADLLLALGAAIGFLLLLVPGVVFLTYFLIAPAVIKLEGRGVRDGFRRSAELVRGNFWRVLTVVVVAVLGTELASEALVALMHTLPGEVVAELVVDALLEPFQGLVTVLVALALIELRGQSAALRGHGHTT